MDRDNGAEPDRLALIVEDLQAELARGAGAVEAAQAALAEAKAKQLRIRRAIDTLTGVKAKAASRPAKKGDWVIGEDKVQRVQALIATKSEPVTSRELATEIGISNDSVRRALELLRERDLVGYRGVRGRGGAKLYMAMPELTNAG
jgi:response regulator of citrate/malate metabolism